MLHFDGTVVRRTGTGFEKITGIPELLETYNPLGDEPLNEQLEIFRQMIPVAGEMFGELSETARLRYDFWKNLLPHRIESRTFAYTTKVCDTYQWELEMTREGLLYRDISGEYSQGRNQVYAQSFSDFWFYGPLLPVPDADTRKGAVAIIRNAFLQTGGDAYNAHFQIFEYPKYANAPQWVFGGHEASTFVNIRNYGVDYGVQNFHDGLLLLNYLSFEHCLNRPDFARQCLGEAVRAEIEARLSLHSRLQATPELFLPCASTAAI